MDSKKIIGYSIILAIVLIFTFLPIYIYDAHPIAVPTIAGFLIAGTVFGMAHLGIISEKLRPIFPAVLALSFGLFAYQGCTRKANELKDNGVLVYGKASHQRVETTTRRGSTSSTEYIEYNFKATNGEKYYSSDYDVSDGSFTNVDLPILYSSKYPSVSVVLNSEENVKKYMDKEDVTVATAEAFIKIVNETNQDSIFSYLSQLSPLWVKVHKTETPTWTYRSSDATLEIDFENNQHILCTTDREAQRRIHECFKEAGYIQETLELETDEDSLEESEENTREQFLKDSVMREITHDHKPRYYKLHNNKEGTDHKEMLIIQESIKKEVKFGFMLQTQYCFYLTGLQDKMTITMEDLQP